MSIAGEPGLCVDRVIIRKRKKITAGLRIRYRSANDLPWWGIALYEDWEGELLFGGRNSQIAPLVERYTRYVMLVKFASKDTETVISID